MTTSHYHALSQVSGERGTDTDTQYTAQSTQHTTHNTQHPTHNTQHTTHNTQHTARSTQHTAHSTQHTAHSTQHTAAVLVLIEDDQEYAGGKGVTAPSQLYNSSTSTGHCEYRSVRVQVSTSTDGSLRRAFLTDIRLSHSATLTAFCPPHFAHHTLPTTLCPPHFAHHTLPTSLCPLHFAHYIFPTTLSPPHFPHLYPCLHYPQLPEAHYSGGLIDLGERGEDLGVQGVDPQVLPPGGSAIGCR
ncbi:hypothetical protein FHG87_018888 [Trinorchestia longiramus]|nr:hypothetical protein FHG87_018888 [Trinorchestia longiramus]